MKKNFLSMISLLLVAVFVFAACGTKEAPAASEDKAPAAETEKATESSDKKSDSATIRLVNGKIEIDEPLKAYAKLYEEKTGVKVEIESIGGGADIGATLKGYLAADNMPDLYVFNGDGEYESWKDHMMDLDDQPWYEDTAVAYTAPDGRVVGFPYAIEGFGITYNKDLLEQAGIDPASLTSYGAYEEAFVKIDSMKDELGIDAVISIGTSVSGGLTWSTGLHNFGSFLATGLDRDDTTMIDGLKAGEIADRARLDQYAKFVGLLFDYSDSYVLKSGSYDEQLALWEDGKTVFIHQGNWIDPSIIKDGVEFEVGIAPSAFLEEETDGILADAPSWWAVYNGSKNTDAALDFLTSLAMTEEGANCLVTEAGMISPFASTSIEPTAPLAKNLMGWVKAGKTYSWQWKKMPDGFGKGKLGPVFEAYATGAVDEKGFADMIETTIGDLK